MYQFLTSNLVLINNDEEFDAFLDEVVPVGTSVMSDFNKAARPHIKRPTEYPTLVTTSVSTGMVFTPVAKVIGGMGNIRQLNMHDAFNSFAQACKECVPFHQPRIMLTGITIKPRTVTKTGYTGGVSTTHNSEAMGAIANLDKNDARLKTLRIQFGDGKFHGGVEMKEEMVFVCPVRDITDQIAKVDLDNNTGRYTAEYAFNHYDFFNTTPELQGYKDMTKWDVAITTSIHYTLDNGK